MNKIENYKYIFLNPDLMPNNKINTLEKQPCPLCHQKTLTLTEEETAVPYFGKVCLFSMTCFKCKYHNADVEEKEKKDPIKYTFEIIPVIGLAILAFCVA